MTRADRLTLVRQLAEQGLSQRAIARRLSVSKDTVRRDLDQLEAQRKAAGAPDDETPGEPDESAAPQLSAVVPEPGAPADEPEAAPPGETPSLPRQVADPLADMDVSRWRALRHDLALLAQTGDRAEALVHQAVVAMAHAYRQDLARGDIQPGTPFLVSAVRLTPLRHRATPVAPAEGA